MAIRVGIGLFLVWVGNGVFRVIGPDIPGISQFTMKGRHRMVLERIEPFVGEAYLEVREAYTDNRASKPSEVLTNGAILELLEKTVHHLLYYPDPELTSRLQEIANRLEANGGADLRTAQRCAEIFRRFEASTPRFAAYKEGSDLNLLRRYDLIPELDGVGSGGGN